MQDRFGASQQQAWYINADGSLDMAKLLRGFQEFFRENSESWLDRFDYQEAGFQLLLQAFLARIINGGGLIDREYALGRGRVDLLVRWRYPEGADISNRKEQRIVIELKTIRLKSSPEKILGEGLEQTIRYALQSNASEANLIICDEREGKSWDEKVFERVEESGERSVNVWGV
jgi:hypothetical protein